MTGLRDLGDLLDAHVAVVAPRPGALDRVRAAAIRRRRRRMAAGGSSLLALLVAMVFVGGSLQETAGPGRTRSIGSRRGSDLVHLTRGPEQARTLRTSYRIHGLPKGQPTVAIKPRPTSGSTRHHVTTVQVATGTKYPLPKGATAASVAPNGDSTAVVTRDKKVVVESTTGDGTLTLHAPNAPGTRISWDPAGTALFALVDRHWVLVPAPAAGGTVRTRASVRTLEVPRLPGGPSFLSVSPGGDAVLLFGLTKATPQAATGPEASAAKERSRAALRPHLFLARFDGHRVKDVRKVPVPSSARRAPVGWLGDNAFLIPTGAGIAWIIRMNASPVPVHPNTIPDPCALEGALAGCRARGPWLLGTNADGSLLFWRERAPRGPEAVPQVAPATKLKSPFLSRRQPVAYFVTWLDGSHAKRLAGVDSLPLAAR